MPIGEQDIVALGGGLNPETMIEAYRQGIFPWPVEGFPVLPWFCPEERAILDFSELHIARSLARQVKKRPFVLTLDRAFDAVVEHCAGVSRAEQGTWIVPEMIEACKTLHRLGYAHSAEAWVESDDPNAPGETRLILVGGVYGISVDGFFSGESMFHLRPYASKLALLHLIDHLKTRGLDWIDIQMLTPHMEQLGARLIARDEFLARLRRTQRRRLKLFEPAGS